MFKMVGFWTGCGSPLVSARRKFSQGFVLIISAPAIPPQVFRNFYKPSTLQMRGKKHPPVMTYGISRNTLGVLIMADGSQLHHTVLTDFAKAVVVTDSAQHPIHIGCSDKQPLPWPVRGRLSCFHK